MSLSEGDIVLVPFPFADLSQTKLKPAVVLHLDITGNDITLCFISSQAVTNLSLEEFAINLSKPDFTGTGLRIVSEVRVSRIVYILQL